MKKTFIGLIIISLSFTLFSGFTKETTQVSSLYQVSTLQALIKGAYDGAITTKELIKHGNTGLGTFDKLDGEMIVIEGKVYKATTEGKILLVSNNETIPFANVGFISSSATKQTSFNGAYDGLKDKLNSLYPKENMPILFSIGGDFENVTCRSVPKQQKPYRPLTEVVKEQVVFKKEKVSGTLVGFRFPEYMSDFNTAGYHLHFISDDKTFGGHLLDIKSGNINVKTQSLNGFNVYLPEYINDISLSENNQKDIATVEKGK